MFNPENKDSAIIKCPILNSEIFFILEILKADLVIEALGFEPEDLPVMFDEPSLNVTQWGTLKVNYNNLMTSLKGVFAAGDIVRGASLVV